jgi:hypothetical protein
VRVFEGLHFDPGQAELPDGAERALDDAGGVRRIAAPGIGGRLLGSATFWSIPLLLLFWLTRGRRRPVRAVLGGLVLYAGLLAAAAVIYGHF